MCPLGIFHLDAKMESGVERDGVIAQSEMTFIDRSFVPSLGLSPLCQGLVWGLRPNTNPTKTLNRASKSF
jgi:hypothetical protein